MNELVTQEEQAPMVQQAVNTLPAIDSTPARLLEMAISKDLDIAKLEKLMAMQKDWEAGQAKKAFYDAMAKFQNECPNICKTKTGDHGTGKANYKYADLGEIADTIKDVLAKNGLSYRWEQKESDSKIGVNCVITHSLGHSEQTYLSAPADGSGNKNALHAIGSTITYLRRITLTCALGIATADQDTDGNQQPPAPTITEQQYSVLIDLLNASNGNEAGFAKHVGVNDLRYLAADKFASAKMLLEKRLEKFKNANPA